MNGVRGEVALEIDGRPHVLCLTLGALAEIETALGCDNMGELEARLKRLSGRDVLVLLRALLRGGGEVGMADRLEAVPIDLPKACHAVGAAFAAALA